MRSYGGTARATLLLGTVLVVSGTTASCTTAPDEPAKDQTQSSCPLTEEQSKRAVDAWAKIASFISTEPRCVNCHGAVNPFIDGVGPDPVPDFGGDAMPISRVEHGGGKQPREANGGSNIAVCITCHDAMVRPKGELTPAAWTLPTAAHMRGTLGDPYTLEGSLTRTVDLATSSSLSVALGNVTSGLAVETITVRLWRSRP